MFNISMNDPDQTNIDETPFQTVSYQNSKNMLDISFLSESQYEAKVQKNSLKEKKLYILTVYLQERILYTD